MARMSFQVERPDLCFHWLTLWQVLVFNGVLSLQICRHVSTM